MRVEMLLLFSASYYSNFYSFWSIFNYLNDGTGSKYFLAQIYYGFTELGLAYLTYRMHRRSRDNKGPDIAHLIILFTGSTMHCAGTVSDNWYNFYLGKGETARACCLGRLLNRLLCMVWSKCSICSLSHRSMSKVGHKRSQGQQLPPTQG